MMRYLAGMISVFLLHAAAYGQNAPHYTMFMYNKLLYNPAYAGSRDVTSVNAAYRDQWVGIKGAPKTFSAMLDAPVGSYMKDFRSVAAGGSITSEQSGIEKQTTLMACYAYRIRVKKTIVSFGLSAGGKFYNAYYSQLNLAQQNDLQFANDVRNAFLPNFGAGIYWSGNKFYVSASAPCLLENYYDQESKKLSNQKGKELRSYYLSGGYTFTVSENIKLQPQVLARYAGNGQYSLPVNCDINLSAIAFDRLLFGITYRTDKSIEAIVHVQASKNINIGYAYDYMASALNGYARGTHELMIGYDFIRDLSMYRTPRFMKSF